MQKASPAELRKFGFIVGGVFGVIGLWPALVHGSPFRSWALVLAILLIGPAVVFPRLLAPVQRGWMKIGHVLGWINTRIILSAIFFLLITPMGWVMRLWGRDPMFRRLDPNAQTYRVKRENRPASHMSQQY